SILSGPARRVQRRYGFGDTVSRLVTDRYRSVPLVSSGSTKAVSSTAPVFGFAKGARAGPLSQSPGPRVGGPEGPDFMIVASLQGYRSTCRCAWDARGPGRQPRMGCVAEHYQSDLSYWHRV